MIGGRLWLYVAVNTPKVRMIYVALKMKEAPYFRKKIVALKIEPNNNEKNDIQIDTSYKLQCGSPKWIFCFHKVTFVPKQHNGSDDKNKVFLWVFLLILAC